MIFCNELHAQTFDFPFSKFSKDSTLYGILSTTGTDIISVEHDKWSNWSSYSANAKFKTLHDFVKFYVDYGNKKVVQSSFVYKLTYHLKGYTNPSTPTVYTSIYDTLTIAYNKDSLKAYQDKFYKKYSGFHKMEIEVNDIFLLDGVNPPQTLTATLASSYGINCRIEGEIWVEYYNKNYYGYSNMTPLTMMQDISYVSTKRELGASWKCTSCGENIKPAMYEFEWTYIDNYAYDLPSHTASAIPFGNLTYNFKNNATRVITKDTFYKIPLVYDKGYLVYRVRMVRPDSVDYINPIYGQWSIIDSAALSSLGSTDYYYNSQAFMNDSLNWQYGISFAEDGKFKHVVSYYDGLLHNKQVTTKVNSDNNYIIVSKSINDYEGRPAIQILPIPVLEQKVDYVKDFAINSQTNAFYKASDFDSIKGGVYCNPPALDSLSTTSRAYTYYSPLNTIQTTFNKYIPNANGYPLIQSVISPENPKKIFTQGGAGKELQIDKGHATEYIYTGATQEELNRFFGSEIGKSSYYNKSIVQDPNGQSSLQVTNNSGKIVYSSMLGNGPDSSLHPVDIMDLPSVLSYTVNVINTVPQTISGTTKSLNTSYFNDYPGNNSVQYSNSFLPYPTCDTTFLSVKSNYYYEILNKCLDIVDSSSGTIGVNGVLDSGVVVVNNGAIHWPYLDKGNYIVNKTLSFNPDDITASVDLFLQTPHSCLYDENHFIKQQIESKKFPCEIDPTSPCDVLKKFMIEELYPDHKYGKYEKNGDGTFELGDENPNSIFTNLNYGIKPDPGPIYRYQDNCLTLPPSLVINGLTYTNIKQLAVDTFINIFNDAIADSLLPLHPEYCKLKACYLQYDNYSDTISNIENTSQAKSLSMFNIADIANNDPLYLKNMVLIDSLVKFNGKNYRIDSFALMQTYCGGLIPQIINTSISEIYQNDLTSTMPSPFDIANAEPLELEFYYGLMTQTYVSNRESIKAKLMSNVPNTCGPCSSKRMTLIPDPIFPDVPLVGGINSQGDSLNQYVANTNFGNLTGLPTWMANSLTSGNINATTLDSINAASAANNSALCNSNIDNLMSKFKNCTLSSTTLGIIRDSLTAIFCINHEKWTVDRISLLLSNLSISQTDICNPYIFQFNNMPGMDLNSENVTCKSNKFYDDAKLFFNSSGMIAALSSTASSVSFTYTIQTSNEFEHNIFNALGYTSGTSASVTIVISYTSAEHQYRMKIYGPSTASTDTVRFWVSGTNNASAFSAYSSGWSFTQVQCLTNYSPVVLPTDVNLHTIFLKASGTIGSSSVQLDYLAYNNKFKTLEINYSVQKITSDASACIEVSRWYKEAKTALDNLGIKYNHQHFEKALLTLINYNTNKLYTYDDIADFVKSCAITDSLKQLVTIANWQLNCVNTAGANSVLNGIANFLGYVPDYLRYKLSSGEEVLLLSYNNMTDDTTYLAFNNYINSVSTSVITNKTYNRSYGNDTLALVFIPGTFTTAPTSSDFANSTDVTVSDMSSVLASSNNIYLGLMNTSTYKLYAITLNNSSTLPAYKISRYVDSLYNFVTHQYTGSYVLSNYAGLLNEDYYLTEKQQWLTHNYTTNTQRHDSVLQRLTIDSLTLNMSSLSGKYIDYGHPVDNQKGDALFINDPSSYSSVTGYNILNAMFDAVGDKIATLGWPSIPSGSKSFVIQQDSLVIPTTGYTSILNGGTNSLKLFRCGSYKAGTYLIRYFDNANKLYTLYFEIPPTLPQPKQLVRDLNKAIKIGPGDGKTFRFNFEAYIPGSYASVKYTIVGYTDFEIGNTLLLQNSLLKPSAFTTYEPWDTTSCERDLINTSITEGKILYAYYIDSVRNSMVHGFMNYMLNNIIEQLNIGIKDRKYYNTLYYYDRAGNLTRTVPPVGRVEFDITNSTVMNSINSDRANNTVNTSNMNAHKKVSTYKYNSINQVFEQNTPDGGQTHFWYDAVGRLVYSQNAKQASGGYYSYVLYDEQARIKETGQFHPNSNGVTEIGNSYNETLAQMTSLITSNTRTEVCATLYDDEGYPLQNETGMSQQENLRKRVSASKYFSSVGVSKMGDTSKNYNFATYYSYDVLGNVKTLTHDFKELMSGKQRFKRVDYQYDLYSGKVNMVSYNRGFADQFYQKYGYDKDNRVVKAESSKDGVYWDRDASYEYYAHGPLARASIGDLNIQGVDYAYTLQGWLKAINGDVLDTLVDMGADGKKNSAYLKDVFALTLDYFNKDYNSISNTPVSVLIAPTKSLYNGNIVRQNLALQPFSGLNKNYRYDPLNRLMSSRYFEINPLTSGPGYDTTYTPEFAEKFTYDLDGNIMKLVRKGNKVGSVIKTMDSLDYFYNANGTNTFANAKNSINTDKLDNVYDYANHGLYSNDIPFHDSSTYSIPVHKRFKYDAIGNLISDEMNGLNAIDWGLYGKVSSVSMPNDASDRFTYDANGNRLSKSYSFYNKTKDTVTELRDIYVRDAQGNILAIYNDERSSEVSILTPTPWDPYIDFGMNYMSGFQNAMARTYAPNSNFAEAIINQASKNAACVASIVDPTYMSSYFWANPELFLRTISYTPGSIALFKANNSDIMNDVLLYISPDAIAENICMPLDSNVHILEAISTINLVNKDAAIYLMGLLDLTYTGDPEADNLILYNLSQSNPRAFKTALVSTLEDPDIIAGFKVNYLNALIDNEKFYASDTSFYFPLTHNLFCSELYRYVLENYTPFETIMNTMKDNVDMFKPTLISVSTPLELIATNYSIDDSDVIAKTCSTFGGANVMKNAMKGISGFNLDMFLADMAGCGFEFEPSLASTTTLYKQHFNLAEHHIYGSSRLGIKKYLPTQYDYLWEKDGDNVPMDSSTISIQQAWYNNAINDFVKFTNPEYAANTNADKTSWISNRIIGLKNYEMTNHLGNVQATVLDKYTPRTKLTSDTMYSIWNANLNNATDYYPFGSPMPGRFTNDTTTQTLVATTPFSSIQKVVIDSIPANTSHFQWSTYGPMSVLTFLTSPEKIECSLTCPTSSPISFINPYGVDLRLQNLVPGKDYTLYAKYRSSAAITLKFEQIRPIPPFGPLILQTTGATATTAVLNLSFTASASGKDTFHFVLQPCGIDFYIDSIALVTDTITTSYITSTLSSKTLSDKYRFGFNGQEKVNEIAGTGNHNTALFWEYDTRLGRRWNLDPIPTVGISEYSTFANNPVVKSDVLGDDPREGGKVLNISSKSMVIPEKWFANVNKEKSTLEKSGPWSSKLRIINDIDLYNKASDVQIIGSIPEFLKKRENDLIVKPITELINDHIENIVSDKFSSSAETFLHAATSSSYDLREYDYDNKIYTDRLVQNTRVKGFEAEVLFKTTHKLTPVMGKDGQTELIDEVIGFTIYSVPFLNKNYGKKGTTFANYKYLQTKREWIQKNDGKKGMGEPEVSTVGTNPRNNSKTE